MRALNRLLLAACVLAAGTAGAQQTEINLNDAPLGAAVTRAWLACAPDAQRLCADVAPGGGRIAGCLLDNSADLSAPCAEEVAKAQSLRAAATTCAPDIAAYCGGVPPGGGRIVSCLVGNQDRIRPDCRDGVAEAASAYGG